MSCSPSSQKKVSNEKRWGNEEDRLQIVSEVGRLISVVEEIVKERITNREFHYVRIIALVRFILARRESGAVKHVRVVLLGRVGNMHPSAGTLENPNPPGYRIARTSERKCRSRSGCRGKKNTS